MRLDRGLVENIAALSVVQALNYAAPLITIPYLVRTLQPAEFGAISFAQSVALCFAVVTDYGFDLSSTREVAANRQSADAVAKIAVSTFSAKILLMLASAVVLVLLTVAVPKLRANAGVIGGSFLYVLGTALFPVWLLQGLEELKRAAAVTALARLAIIPALFLFVRHPHDSVIAATLQASVKLLAAMILLPFLWKRIAPGWRWPTWGEMRCVLKTGWPLFVSVSTGYFALSSSGLILGFVVTKTELGYYGAADKLIKAATSLASPASQALYPRISAVKQESETRAAAILHKSFWLMGSLSLLVSVFIFLLAGPICRALLGAQFLHSTVLLRWMSPLPFLFVLMNVLGTQAMLPYRLDSAMSRIMVAGSLIAVPLTWLLARWQGAVGAVVASDVTTLCMVSAMAAVLSRQGLPVWRLRREPVEV